MILSTFFLAQSIEYCLFNDIRVAEMCKNECESVSVSASERGREKYRYKKRGIIVIVAFSL